MDVTLHSLIKVEDWFKDGTSFLRTYKKGKGAQPNSDSIVRVYLKITVNDEVKLNNFPDGIDNTKVFADLTEEKKEEF